MTHVRFPNFSQPVPVRRPALTTDRRLLPIDCHQQSAPSALPNEPLPGEIEPWQALASVRPDTAFVRARRVMDAFGDLLSAVLIVGVGATLTALATPHRGAGREA